jgi:predicted Zn-dependent protease
MVGNAIRRRWNSFAAGWALRSCRRTAGESEPMVCRWSDAWLPRGLNASALVRVLFITGIVATAGAMANSRAQTSDPELYFVAIGTVPAEMIDSFAAHFGAKYRIPIKTLTPLGADRLTFDERRSQMVADKLIQAVRFRYPTLVKNPRTRVIAITSHDMYMEAMREQWAFTFSLRSGDRRFAVVSYARMDPSYFGQRPDEALLRGRLRKMVTKNIGIMYFGLPASDNPRSAMFRNILGVDDLDRMTDEFDPK